MNGEKWRQKEITYIKDIVITSGDIMNHTEMNNVYDIGCNYLDMLLVRHNIPAEWRNTLKGINLSNYSFQNINKVLLIRKAIKITAENLTFKTGFGKRRERRFPTGRCV